ncbi:glycosyltransferase [Campylobacter sp. MIT 97-5078]|uniref:glycosyltransferase n=1 Tax=Campylobacter sp. MIT 97-5078 TaxID=1548153 RepID=UPI000513E5BF|nr:glycosyltransferase [Campylobacter sp. MIT 97-5078]KGI55462.1 hypothetical protein LR59_11985 [Campylobacter sp. MIT 97-5078]TQR23257.1 hypothetical protein DMB91_08125 [Campylobacter sp. MIT 97-5078]
MATFLTPKKLKKLRENPKAFFGDALKKRIFPIQIFLKRFKPKKYKAYQKYVIVSAVYNVEKYLDDYFRSIIKQRLDFKKNIIIICVDDGSSDNSAKIIRKYQNQFPENIIYLHKENGGQASARNLGLEYLDNNLSKLAFAPTWITFTDPDDFLDSEYFYNIDNFLCKHKNKDIRLVGCPLILYYEASQKTSLDNQFHYVFEKDEYIVSNYHIDDTLFGVMASSVFCIKNLKKLRLLESMRYGNEDTVFVTWFLLENEDGLTAVLPSAKYYYRKRKDKSSTIDTIQKEKKTYLLTFKEGYLKLLEETLAQKACVPDFVQKQVIVAVVWNLHSFVNNPNALYFLSEEEKKEYLQTLDKIFSYISDDVILDFRIINAYAFHQIGMLYCFKKTQSLNYQKAYIEKYDHTNNEILITYFTPEPNDSARIVLDNQDMSAISSKIVQYDFLNRVFIYKKCICVRLPKSYAFRLKLFVKDLEIFSTKVKKVFTEIHKIKDEYAKKSNFWIFIDGTNNAGDNAECLYRFIKKNYPEQEIYFALNNKSSDWQRLEKEGFALLNINSFAFKGQIQRCAKIFSSRLIYREFKFIKAKAKVQNQYFVYLPSNILNFASDLSNLMNTINVDLLISSNAQEYKMIVQDFSHYDFTEKEVKYFGHSPRLEYLLEQEVKIENFILIKPMFRKFENYSMFKESLYFKRWHSLINNSQFQDLIKTYKLKIVLNLETDEYVEFFSSYEFIEIKVGDSLNLLAKASIFLSDYHPFLYDAHIIQKPSIAYHFEKKEEILELYCEEAFFADNTLCSVLYNEAEVIEKIELFLNHGFEVKKVPKQTKEKSCKEIYDYITRGIKKSD